jgi:hypothetical protein
VLSLYEEDCLMRTNGRFARWVSGFTIFTALGLVVVAAAPFNRNPATVFKKCVITETPGPGGWVAVPNGAKVDCLREIASLQKTATVTQQNYVPSNEADCSTDPVNYPNTTQIITTAYTGMKQMPFDEYGKREGFIVARIDNVSNCTTKSYGIAPGHSYFVVIEGKGTKARLVDVATGTETKLAKFNSCTKEGHPPPFPEKTLDIAFLRSHSIRCNHKPVPEGEMKLAFGDDYDKTVVTRAIAQDRALPQNPKQKSMSAKRGLSKNLIDDEFAIWISCGTDCCFADAK